jgi:hypothetical protein
MVYEIKDQDVSPSEPNPGDIRSSRNDAAGAFAIALITAGLIAAIIFFQIL